MKINKNLYLFLLVYAWRNYENLQKKLRMVVTNVGTGWKLVRWRTKVVEKLFIEYLFIFFSFENQVYVLPSHIFRSYSLKVKSFPWGHASEIFAS